MSKVDNKSEREILEILKKDFEASKTLRASWDAKIEEWRKWYNGEPYGNEKKNKSAVVSRDIRRQAEWQHPGLLDPFVSTPDIIKAKPVTFEDGPAARQNELLLNTQFCRQFNRYTFMSKAIKLLNQEGTAIIMTGWDYEDKEEEVEVPIIEVDMYGEPVIVGYETQLKTVVVKNQPTAKLCRNEDVFIDPTCHDDLDNAQFVIYRYETDMSSLLQEGKYSKDRLRRVAKEAESEEGRNDFNNPDETEFKFNDDPRKKLLVHEYWGNYDINGDGIAEPIVCSWIGNTIIRLESNPFPDGKVPFILASYTLTPFQLYGEASAALIGDNQQIKTAIYRGIIDNMALSNNGQKGIRKSSLDPINRSRFFNGENFEFNGSREDFWDGNYNNIPQSVFEVINLQNNDIESLTGVKSFSGGITGASLGSTATGARGALDATTVRRLDLVRNISENLVKPLMRKWMAYNAEFLLEEQVIRITNEEFVTVRRDDLSGRIDIDISISTSEDNAAKAQELAFMLQTIGPNEDPEVRKMLMAEIAELQKMPDLAKMLRDYQPEPDPIEMRRRELEVALLEAQVANELAKAKENEVDVGLKTARTHSEMAKAKHISAQADLKDLDFLEQESGINHRRTLETMQQEAKNKAKIEAMKKYL